MLVYAYRIETSDEPNPRFSVQKDKWEITSSSRLNLYDIFTNSPRPLAVDKQDYVLMFVRPEVCEPISSLS